MAREIERKFLVNDSTIIDGLDGQRLTQGYLSHDKHATVRVRIAGDRAWLTLKGKTEGHSRLEFEYPVPVSDARQMLEALCRQGVIDKTRYRLPQGELCWEIDVFHGDNAGLVMAEIELPDEDTDFARPTWLGEEVSHDPRYFNSALSSHPYRHW